MTGSGYEKGNESLKREEKEKRIIDHESRIVEERAAARESTEKRSSRVLLFAD